MKNLVLIPLLFATLAHAQVVPAPLWIKVANENDSVIATTTVRYGAAQGATATAGFKPCATVGGCWVQLSVSGTFAAGNTFFKTDPIPGTAKELDVLQTTSAQVVTVNGTKLTVPAFTPVIVPPVPPPTPPPTVNSITFSIDEMVEGIHVTGTCTVTPVVGK